MERVGGCFFMKHSQNARGITLIELLIVVVVLGVIAGISVISIGNIVNNTRVRADEANTITLNQATRLYHLTNPSSTVFSDPNQTPEALIQYLYTQQFLRDPITPMASDGFFTYDFSLGVWLYRGIYIISLDDLQLRPSGFYKGRIEGVYEGTSTHILIPDMIDGTTVLSIDSDVFNYFGTSTKKSSVPLDEVMFTSQSQLERIHARAFRGNNLTQIQFPSTLNRIDLWAFRNNQLTALNLPESLTLVEQRAFDDNPLTTITIGTNVTIDPDAFGPYTHTFITAYDLGGAGTYVLNNNTWEKQ